MTQTNQQLITDAFNIIGVVADGKQASPNQATQGIKILNGNLLTQQRDGWQLGWYPQGVANLADNAPLRDEDMLDVTLCLASWLAPWNSVEIKPDPDPDNMASLANQIKAAFRRLNKRSLRIIESDLGELSRSQGGPWGGPNWL